MMARFKTWMRTRNPVLKFLGVFCGLMIVFYTVTQFQWFKDTVFKWNIKVNAIISNWILNILQQKTHVEGSKIMSNSFVVDIHRGCDALEPIAFFVFALLAFPAPVKRKAMGILWGVVILFGLNLIRIVSLYLIGLKSERLFEFMHADLWQVIFILAAIVLWGIWSFWATQSRPVTTVAPAG